jgi:GTP-binding protein
MSEADRIEEGRLLFARECLFMRGVTALENLPHADRVEVAFAGRSNVGKSSLINALTGRKNLARASKEPGRTQEINFFDLGGELYLVDLPGHGYASQPKAKIKAWTALTRSYFRGRPNLRRVCLLADARHGLKDTDTEVMDLLDETAVNYQVVLTKADKVTAAELAKLTAALKAMLAKRPASHPEIPATSAVTGAGIPELRAELARLREWA